MQKKRNYFFFSRQPCSTVCCLTEKLFMRTNKILVSAIFLFLITFLSSCEEEDVVVTPQNKLVAVAGPDQTVTLHGEVTLDASASEDGNNRPFSFSWSVRTRPQGSIASIDSARSVKTTFTPDVIGMFVIRLTISQGNWTAHDDLVINARPPEGGGPEMITLNEDITVNTTLNDIFEDPDKTDYLVTDDIDVRSDLTIMPGVVIAFAADKGLQIVNGSFSAKGTAEKKIILKGLDNGVGYWKGILIISNSQSNEFEYVTVQQGGSSVFAESGTKANVALAGTPYSGGALKVGNSVFTESGGYGLYVQGMSSLERFSSNTFSNNVSVPAYIPASQLHNIDTNNAGLTEIETGGTILIQGPVVWKKIENGSYLVTSDIHIKAGVTVEAGASFKMKTASTINVTDNGHLKLLGTSASRITFRSTAPGVYWNGFYFNSYNTNNRIEHSEIANAGLNKIADADHAANIVLGHAGLLIIEHSIIKTGLGYGLVAKTTNQVNANIKEVNTFSELEKGSIFPDLVPSPGTPSLTGAWMDEWSFMQRFSSIHDNFYNRETQTWFAGAANPWAMEENGKGMGIYFDGDLNFTWLIAEHSPATGCESYSAEYITGTGTATAETLTFNQDYWRSKFINSCDESQNVDMDIQPSAIILSYKIEKMYNVFTGEGYWALTFTNPDNSTFSFYRRDL